MSNCTEKTEKENKGIKETLAKHGLTEDVARDVLQLIEDADLDDKDGVVVRIVTLKSTKKKQAAKNDQEVQKEENQDSPSKEDLEQRCNEHSEQLIRLFLLNNKLSEEIEALYSRLAKLEQK